MSRTERFRNIFLICLIALAVGLAYTALHEGGHALAGLAFGGRVTDFDVNFFDLGAHVGLDGDFSRAQNAVINLSGTALPLLVWLLAFLLLPRQGSLALLWIKIIFSMGTLNTLLAWIILPILAVNGNAPPGEDVSRFLSNSGVPPLAVALAAALLYLAGWTLFLRRTGDLRQALVPLGIAPGTVVPPRRRSFAGLAVLVFLVLAVVAIFFLLGGKGPQGSSRVAQVNLAERSYEAETLYRFTAREGVLVDVYVSVANIDTRYIDLTLVGADGTAYVLLHGEGFWAASSTSQGSYGLATGEARLVLTSQASPGRLTIYTRETP